MSGGKFGQEKSKFLVKVGEFYFKANENLIITIIL